MTLTDINSNGSTHSVTKPVIVIVPPIAAFSTDPQKCANSPVQFTDLSTASHGFINKWTWDFGDGTPPVVISYPGSSNVTHTYSAGGTYNTTLTIQTSDLCLSNISHQIIVTEAPLANYTFTDNLCLGKSVQFTDLSQTNGGGAISSWLWNFNDPTSGVSNTSSLQNPVHIFSIVGTHNVSLTTTNVNNCSGTISKQIIVGAGPAVKFIITSDTCVASDVSFEPDTAVMDLTSVASYLWNFGEGGATSTSSAPTHVYNVAGTFQVTMSVVYNNGCTNSVSRPVTIGAPPVAAFNYISACLGNAATFTDYSYTGSGEPIVSWLWKFNDPNGTDSSTQRNPVFRYISQGLHNVTLTVTAANGCPGSITIPVQVLAAPKANFNFITNTCANGNVSFQDSSISYISAITEWKWEFEPGYISTLKNPNHIFYNTDSSYNVRLVVTDMRGCIDTAAKDVYVPAGLEVEIEDPLACFGVDTWFKPKAPAGDSLIAFQWNFGDLASGSYNTSNLRNPFHYFQTPGSYLVSLTATDLNNCSKTVYHQVDIQKLPVPVFIYTIADCDSVVHFNASPTGGSVGIKRWIWNFGDGESDTINVPSNGDTLHTYASPGIYYVTLTVINGNLCSASFSDSLLVKPCLDAIFTQVDTLGCQNQAITFVDNSSSGVPLIYPITEWFWDFGDGSDSTYNAYQDTITHIFNTSGTFNVKLVISAQIAGKTVSDSASLEVLINPSPTAMFNTADVCLNLPSIFINTSSGNGSSISSYAWDFGDPGTTLDSSLVNNPTYLYKQSGAFNVALIAMNPFGCSDTIIHTLTVHPLPKADFQFSNSCAGFPTHFTDISDTVNAALIKWQWIFMDTILIKYDTLPNPDYLFATKGNHQVRLIITDKNGCQDDTLKPVVTYPVTVSAFEIMEDYDNVQGRIHLINGTLGATGYEWDFGNGITSIEKEPTLTYDPVDIYKINTYKIKLISYIYPQCPDTLKKDYTLLLKGLYVPNAFSPTNLMVGVQLFKPVGMNISDKEGDYLVEVYDSWGKLLWSSTKLDLNGSPEEGWDGTSPNGNLLPQDVYVWRISAVFRDGTVWNSKNAGDHTNIPEKTYGTVTLLR